MILRVLKCIGVWTFFLVIIHTKKPTSKRQQEVWRLECELGVVTDSDCPVDGGWTPWSPWSPCHGPCDDVGHQQRTRQCINPPPSQDGIPCTGLEEQTETCFLTNCTAADFRRLVNGDTARMEALRQLEAVPAIMERCLQMECPFEAIEAALAADNTWQLNPEALWISLQCVKHNTGCPVIGEWGVWGAWSTCGARCGRGMRWRLRRCDTPPPSDAHLICIGSPLQADECEGDQCAVDKKGFGGDWGEWGAWSTCSENCGTGVRRRRRMCLETHTPISLGIWGTHCRGQHDQIEVCENKRCKLDGGWSGWTAWGPCSQNCGAGRRSRTRSCTRPIPARHGTPCVGPRTEVGSCYQKPCEVHSHTVALFNGESFLHYNFQDKRSTLFHFFVRFMPLSPHGTLVRRGTVRGPHVRLSLQKWHLCLDASGSSRTCSLPQICSHSIIEPSIWHSALVTVTSEAAALRLDDGPTSLKTAFPCDPDLIDDKINIYVGEKFHGEIQELILNFIPLKMIIERDHRATKSGFFPSAASNIAYEKAGLEEAYFKMNNEHYMRLPCFTVHNEWRLELSLKPKRDAGTILFLIDQNNWLHMALQNMRLKLKLALGDFRSESSSSTECLPGQWLDITLSKKQETNSIEATVNAGERLYVLLDEKMTRRRRESYKMIEGKKTFKILVDRQSTSCDTTQKPMSTELCRDEYFVGGVPADIKNKIREDFSPFYGTVASISVNRVLLDLHDYSVERYKDDLIQVSSRTASVSGSYHETAWGKSNRLNLTCLHARTTRSPHQAHWLFLDTGVNGTLKDESVQSVDDGRVLRLVATANNDLRGFYTCRALANKRTRNVVTYGVLGKIQYNLSSPDTTTVIAVFTTVMLVIVTLGWLIIEGINDLRDGYGFFRDAHLSPEEEAEAVCKYIDQNIHLVGSKSAARLAKAKARRRAHQLASRASFAAQEPQGLIEENQLPFNGESSPSEPDGLPALPEIKSSSIGPSHDVYRCEPSYVSSPRHGSMSSPRLKLTSSSSFEIKSPRHLCSRLIMTRPMYSSRESLVLRRNSIRGSFVTPKARSNLLTIKSSTYMNQSPAHKILQKFKELKSDDP